MYRARPRKKNGRHRQEGPCSATHKDSSVLNRFARCVLGFDFFDPSLTALCSAKGTEQVLSPVKGRSRPTYTRRLDCQQSEEGRGEDIDQEEANHCRQRGDDGGSTTRDINCGEDSRRLDGDSFTRKPVNVGGKGEMGGDVSTLTTNAYGVATGERLCCEPCAEDDDLRWPPAGGGVGRRWGSLRNDTNVPAANHGAGPNDDDESGDSSFLLHRGSGDAGDGHFEVSSPDRPQKMREYQQGDVRKYTDATAAGSNSDAEEDGRSTASTGCAAALDELAALHPRVGPFLGSPARFQQSMSPSPRRDGIHQQEARTPQRRQPGERDHRRPRNHPKPSGYVSSSEESSEDDPFSPEPVSPTQSITAASDGVVDKSFSYYIERYAERDEALSPPHHSRSSSAQGVQHRLKQEQRHNGGRRRRRSAPVGVASTDEELIWNDVYDKYQHAKLGTLPSTIRGKPLRLVVTERYPFLEQQLGTGGTTEATAAAPFDLDATYHDLDDFAAVPPVMATPTHATSGDPHGAGALCTFDPTFNCGEYTIATPDGKPYGNNLRIIMGDVHRQSHHHNNPRGGAGGSFSAGPFAMTLVDHSSRLYAAMRSRGTHDPGPSYVVYSRKPMFEGQPASSFRGGNGEGLFPWALVKKMGRDDEDEVRVHLCGDPTATGDARDATTGGGGGGVADNSGSSSSLFREESTFRSRHVGFADGGAPTHTLMLRQPDKDRATDLNDRGANATASGSAADFLNGEGVPCCLVVRDPENGGDDGGEDRHTGNRLGGGFDRRNVTIAPGIDPLLVLCCVAIQARMDVEPKLVNSYEHGHHSHREVPGQDQPAMNFLLTGDVS